MEMSMQFDEQFIKNTLTDVSIIQNYFPEDVEFSVDSRTLEIGDIFVALSGAQTDGHHFVADAFKKGASGCLLNSNKLSILETIPPELLKNKLIIAVPDTLQALVSLAHAWRMQFSYPVVGITGSVGKTSTKELLAHVLDLDGIHYLISRGNQNTLIGASLNLLRMRPDHKVAIFEMGISNRGEMVELARLVHPTTALITTIGHQHMDGIGSLYDIAVEKRNIFKYFSEENIGIINGDQTVLSEVSYSHPVLKFGTKMTNQIQARKIRVSGVQVSFILKIYGEKYPIVIKKSHAGIIWHTLAVAAIARLLGVSDKVIVEAVQMPLVVAGRFEERSITGGQGIMINDCYNANPESMKAALLAFQNIQTKSHKIAVLGDMLGLGVNSPFWHRQIGRFLRKVPSVRKVILVGNLVEWTRKTLPFGVTAELVADWKEAAALLETELVHAPLVLIKGSRDLGLSNLVERFAKLPEKPK
jgi:UDP-N-acetylmuramoyl-tripeptide--D-alanyl-D-alanine ligase